MFAWYVASALLFRLRMNPQVENIASTGILDADTVRQDFARMLRCGK